MGPPHFATVPSQSQLTICPSGGNGNSSVYSGNGPLYQVDYTCVNAGKTIGATKRRIRWRFGFANEESLAEGKRGPECRGEEHEITLTWSLTSGKRVVLADGHEVHVSCEPYSMVFECSWNMRGNHVVRIKGHAKPAALREANERQFDMWIDDRSFFHFDQIFNLGHSANRDYQKNYYYESRSRESIQEQPRPRPTIVTKEPPSENVEWPTKKAFNINQTTPRTVSTFESSTRSFDFMSQPNTPTASFNAAPAPTLETMPSMYEPQYGAERQWLPASPYGAPVPVPPIDDRYEMQHRINKVEYDVMEAYKQAPMNSNNKNAIVHAEEQNKNQYSIPTEISTPPLVTEKENVGVEENRDAYFEGDEFYTTPMLEEPDVGSVVPPTPVDPINELVNKLCNLNDITSAPEKEVKLTINPFKQEDEKKKKKVTKSTPTAPVSSKTWYGPQPTLSEMKAVQLPKTPTQEIMKPNLFQQQTVMSGQMVVYGQTQNMNEAPPLDRRPQGFGVGAYTNPGYGQHTAPYQYAVPQTNYSY